jgi:hypothetical protein
VREGSEGEGAEDFADGGVLVAVDVVGVCCAPCV